MPKSLLLVAAFLVALLSARAEGAPLAFNDGELFEFRVAWGVFRGAGVLQVEAKRQSEEGIPHLRIATETRTAGFIGAFYPFEGKSECTFDARDGRLLEAVASTKGPSKTTDAIATVDYENKRVRYLDHIDSQRSEDLPLPPGQPMDMITTLLASRAWDLEPGQSQDVVVMFDKEFYELKIVALRIEKTNTPNGEVETLVLSPRMEKDPRGMFRRGGQVHVWVSRDEKKLPVKLQVSLKFGTATAFLTRYEPGTVAEQNATGSGL